MSRKVFISSSSQDSTLAQDLARRLKQTGADVILPEISFAPGEHFVATIDQRLRNSDEVIVLLSDSSVDSPTVMSEMGAAFALHKRVTPVLVGMNERELPSMLKNMRHVRYSDLEDYFAANDKTTEAKRGDGNSSARLTYHISEKSAKSIAEAKGSYGNDFYGHLARTPRTKAEKKRVAKKRN